MKVDRVFTGLAVLASFAVVPVAEAHIGGGHGAGFAAGLQHPFAGLDHLLAMLAVGLWAAQQRGHTQLTVPLAFAAMLLAGAGIAWALAPAVAAPLIETGIAVSVLVVGLLIAAGARAGTATGLLLIGTFAVFHGHAHGTELPVTASPSAYLAGMLIASIGLHVLGWLAGRQLQRREREMWLARIGGGVAAAGVLLLAGQW